MTKVTVPCIQYFALGDRYIGQLLIGRLRDCDYFLLWWQRCFSSAQFKDKNSSLVLVLFDRGAGWGKQSEDSSKTCHHGHILLSVNFIRNGRSHDAGANFNCFESLPCSGVVDIEKSVRRAFKHQVA